MVPVEARLSALETVLHRDRAIVLTAAVGLAVLTWLAMAREAQSMNCLEICGAAGVVMSAPDIQPWAAAALGSLFLMWAVMMIAMMTPSVAPMLIAFATINRRRRELAQPFVPTSVFLGGYLTAWTLFSVGAALAQWVLHSTLLLPGTMILTSPRLAGGLLIAAGVYQWTPLKHACLRHCRSPLSFLMTRWREGRAGAFRMGFQHGAYCTGCCWILMLLLFVTGVMNLWWIAALSVYVLVEKVAPRGAQLGRFVGLALAGWGAWIVTGGS